MSQHSSDDLVNFLRNNRPSSPPQQADIEDRLMAQIETETDTKVRFFPQLHHYKWVFSGVLAASLLLVFTGIRTLQPTPSQQNAELEDFLTENWEAVTTPSPSYSDWEFLTPEE
ncbi:hypothetical protein FRE64_11225 [Euhalothece natronophila Z-M001]|uniref:Uncharacterized protein n=1 Tax=Euhalothece natronophila Z-M001 TaxID=522448 RepID=A0A5B8NQK4_9CHRO|nr:hypothetical protein [Euhalothece natronophila]QDZ40475.1 hypothetical protein FRE64_11225 [Euhalothece natronophila Z-M001]